jgi:hypothetical protein
MGIESPCGIRRCEVGYQPPLSLHVKNRPDFQAGFFFCSTIPPREKRLLEQKFGPRIDALNKIPMLEIKAVGNGMSFLRETATAKVFSSLQDHPVPRRAGGERGLNAA